MRKNHKKTKKLNRIYPIGLSISMIIGALVLSFVDLAFLNDVIGKVLDLDNTMSLIISFVLGLVGLAVIGHKGIKNSHTIGKSSYFSFHYVLWIFIGLTIVTLRLYSATLLQLDGTFNTDKLIELSSLKIRQVDLILAPFMLLLYIASGLLVKDGIENLIRNPNYKKVFDFKKLFNKIKNWVKARNNEIKINKDQQLTFLDESKNLKAFELAVAKYKNKQQEILQTYQKIESNIEKIKTLDKDEQIFQKEIKPDLLEIINNSLLGTQNAVALSIKNKSGENIHKLREVIKNHNEKNQKITKS